MNYFDFITINSKKYSQTRYQLLLVIIFLLISFIYVDFFDYLLTKDILSIDKQLIRVLFLPSLLLIVTILSLIIIWIFERIFKFVSYLLFYKKIQDPCSLPINKLKKIVDYTGNLRKEKNKIVLINSLDGLIFKKYYPRKIKFECNFRLLEHGFGVIFYAEDLKNYLMLKINRDKDNNDKPIYISPHIRKNGLWEVQLNNFDIGEYKDPVVNRAYIPWVNNEYLNNKNIFKLILNIENYDINLKILSQNGGREFNYNYTIPNHTIFPIDTEQQGMKIGYSFGFKPPFFNRVGFRAASPDEIVEIWDLKIKKLNNDKAT
ncbi:MAG: hypothetical protein ACD_26C00145G0002 [uncultured bacterium]|nr:MAG: hypothetical protein ACD_26C00145G0002 [uncultured bacterium]